MTRPERAQIILEAVDKTFPIPGYLQIDVKEAIVKAQVMAERSGFNTLRYQALIIFIEIDRVYPIPVHRPGWIETITDAIKGLEAQDEAKDN
jgi:hypothetical protein